MWQVRMNVKANTGFTGQGGGPVHPASRMILAVINS